MFKIVADTNIFISAYNYHGKPEQFLLLPQLGLVKLFISPEILNEFKRINRHKMGWSEEKIRQTLFHIGSYSELTYPAISLNIVKDDPSDDRILECAVAAGADFIVTGDEKHLLKLKQFQGIKIIRPAKFLADFYGN